MGKDVSLILAPGKLLINIVKAGQEPDAVKAILDMIKPQQDELYDRLPDYLNDVLSENDLKDLSNFNTNSGFVAAWILSSVKPAWYLRNCSVSLFLESQDIPEELWPRYISNWQATAKDILPGLDIKNHFTDANYSVGCVISPANCINFLEDYRKDIGFKTTVDSHFGIFIAILVDALCSAVESNTELIEAMDIFVVYIIDLQTGRWQFNDQYSYTTNTYQETGIALQALSIEAQLCTGQMHKHQQAGNKEKVDAYAQERDTIIGSAVKNGNVYTDSIRAKTGLDIPVLTAELWV